MATVYGTNATKIAAGGLANKIDNGNIDAKIKIFIDDYTFAASAAGTVVKVGPTLPAGAVILDVRVMNAASGGSVTFSVGDSDTAARYISAADGNSAAAVKVLTLNMGYVIGTTTGDNQILITTAGASATGKFVIVVKYAMD